MVVLNKEILYSRKIMDKKTFQMKNCHWTEIPGDKE